MIKQRNILPYILIFGLIFLLLNCSSGETNRSDKKNRSASSTGPVVKDEIIVYGNKTCPHCMQFIKKLEDEGFSYIFKEVDNNDGNFQEMYDKVKSINYKGYVNYPIVDINGKILVAPDYQEFKKHL